MSFFKKIFTRHRKSVHIQLAPHSIVDHMMKDERFYYEPMLASHLRDVLDHAPMQQIWLKKSMRWPLWISSMTGGADAAFTINQRLAKACKYFGLGMGLGSCRSLLTSEKYLKDFDLRPILGEDILFFANLGIAQIEEAVQKENIQPINHIIQQLNTDGLIIHINPIQEFIQPEGNLFTQSPLLTVQKFLQWVNYPVIIKEVGQGFGPKSLRELLQLPLAAIELAGFGGTNFALLETLRCSRAQQKQYLPLAKIGHSSEEMIAFLNYQKGVLEPHVYCQKLIISGGIQSFLDGYYLMGLSQMPAIYGQAGKLLQQAKISYKALCQYLTLEIKGLALAKNFFQVKKDH